MCAAVTSFSLRNGGKKGRIGPLEPEYQPPDGLNWKPKFDGWNAVVFAVNAKLSLLAAGKRAKANLQADSASAAAEAAKKEEEPNDEEADEKQRAKSNKPPSQKKKAFEDTKVKKNYEWKPREEPPDRCILNCSVAILVLIFLFTIFGVVFIFGGYDLFCVAIFETKDFRDYVKDRRNVTNETCPSV